MEPYLAGMGLAVLWASRKDKSGGEDTERLAAFNFEKEPIKWRRTGVHHTAVRTTRQH